MMTMKFPVAAGVLSLSIAALTLAKAADQPRVFALVPKSISVPFYNDVERGMNDEAKKIGIQAKFTGPPTADAAQQVQILQDLVSQGISGIAVAPMDADSVIGVIASARRKGIPVITFDSDSPKADRISFVGTNNLVGGEKGGEAFKKLMPKGKFAIITGGLAAVNLAGPRAREVLTKLTSCDLSSKAFPYMSCRQAAVGGVEALLMRIGFVGETGWEIHFPAECGAQLWRALLAAGIQFDIKPFGVEAQRLLRLEKRHVIVGVDTDALTNPFEAGMDWVAKLEKEDFIGRTSLQRLAGEQPRQSLVGFVMNENALPEDGAAILANGELAGRVTSVRYSPVNKRAIGMAWVPAKLAREGTEIEVRVGGGLARARVTLQAFYDPEGARLRM